MLFYVHNVIKLLFVDKTEPYELNWIEISKFHVGTYIPTCSDCISLWIRLMLPEKKKRKHEKTKLYLPFHFSPFCYRFKAAGSFMFAPWIRYLPIYYFCRYVCRYHSGWIWGK